jgi:hypothetical protein
VERCAEVLEVVVDAPESGSDTDSELFQNIYRRLTPPSIHPKPQSASSS